MTISNVEMEQGDIGTRDILCLLFPCPESLVGASSWLDPGGSHRGKGVRTMPYVGVSSLGTQSSATIIVGAMKTSRPFQSELPRSPHSSVVV